MIAAIPEKLAIRPATEPPGGEIVAGEWFPEDLFSGEHIFARLKIGCPGSLAPYKVRLQAQVSFNVSVEDVIPYDGENISFQLARFTQAIGHVIAKFEVEIP